MTADDDGLHPPRHGAGDTLQYNRLTEHRPAQDVADGAVGALPHLLQLKFLHTRLIRCDGRALDTHTVLLDGLGGLDGNLVAGLQRGGGLSATDTGSVRRKQIV